jgi:hypothetical protein
VQENQQASSFLQLPAEIRSAIYEYALGDETFRIVSGSRISDKEERKKKEYLALLQVSRQVRILVNRSLPMADTSHRCTWRRL